MGEWREVKGNQLHVGISNKSLLSLGPIYEAGPLFLTESNIRAKGAESLHCSFPADCGLVKTVFGTQLNMDSSAYS